MNKSGPKQNGQKQTRPREWCPRLQETVKVVQEALAENGWTATQKLKQIHMTVSEFILDNWAGLREAPGKQKPAMANGHPPPTGRSISPSAVRPTVYVRPPAGRRTGECATARRTADGEIERPVFGVAVGRRRFLLLIARLLQALRRGRFPCRSWRSFLRARRPGFLASGPGARPGGQEFPARKEDLQPGGRNSCFQAGSLPLGLAPSPEARKSGLRAL